VNTHTLLLTTLTHTPLQGLQTQLAAAQAQVSELQEEVDTLTDRLAELKMSLAHGLGAVMPLSPSRKPPAPRIPPTSDNGSSNSSSGSGKPTLVSHPLQPSPAANKGVAADVATNRRSGGLGSAFRALFGGGGGKGTQEGEKGSPGPVPLSQVRSSTCCLAVAYPVVRPFPLPSY
jgi:hypothetical protein